MGNQLPHSDCVHLELCCACYCHCYIVAKSIPGLECQPGEGVNLKGLRAASISWYTAFHWQCLVETSAAAQLYVLI